jgi:hypothetical protein
MKQYVVMLISGDTQGNVDHWVYHKAFTTLAEANEVGISFCKDGEAQLIELGAAYEYSDTMLYLKENDGYFLMNGYNVFPVDVIDPDGIDYTREDVLYAAEEAEVELTEEEISWVLDKILKFDYSSYNEYVADRVSEVVAKRGE